MINSVEKIYSVIDSSKFIYKIIYENNKNIFVPDNEANRHYQEILEWVENGGIIVDNGA